MAVLILDCPASLNATVGRSVARPDRRLAIAVSITSTFWQSAAPNWAAHASVCATSRGPPR